MASPADTLSRSSPNSSCEVFVLFFFFFPLGEPVPVSSPSEICPDIALLISLAALEALHRTSSMTAAICSFWRLVFAAASRRSAISDRRVDNMFFTRESTSSIFLRVVRRLYSPTR